MLGGGRVQEEIVLITAWEGAHGAVRDWEGHEVAELVPGVSSEWKKSSRSGTTGCVEVRIANSGIEVRDSKNPGGGHLKFTTAEWDAFVEGVALGEFRIAGPPAKWAV
jgi:Domain of unknown function (DUF397)